MRHFLAHALLCIVFALLSLSCKKSNTSHSTDQKPLKINGSTTVNLAAAEAAGILRSERGMQITVDTQGGSAGGLSMLGDGLAEIAMCSKPLTDEDQKKQPGVSFYPTLIGKDAVAIVVSSDVWTAGVQQVSKQQVRQIYEGQLTNWKELGGPDERIVFFNKEPGRGTWEVFATWLYGSPKQAPPVSFPEVGGNEEARNRISTTLGAMGQLSSSWADGRTLFALGIITDGEDGRASPGATGREVVFPTHENIRTGSYPLVRPLLLVTNGEPHGDAAVFINFMVGERGQAIVRKQGYLSLDQAGTANH